jgi:hypothetical protein
VLTYDRKTLAQSLKKYSRELSYNLADNWPAVERHAVLLQQEPIQRRPAPGFDDLVFVEQRQDIRVIVSVPGRYSLADHRNSRGERRIYACRAVNISPKAIALAAPNGGALGERVIANIDHLGKLEGAVIRHLDRGFVMSINASDEERVKLATKIEWVDRHKNLEIVDKRSDVRFVPSNPYSWLLLSDGHRETCFVLDLSISGAAISANMIPEIGTVLAIGAVIGRVVRYFEGGFAVKFIMRQTPEAVETLVIRR